MLTNWSFWAVVLSALAIVLSQLPPVRYWFKGAKIEIELYSRIFLTHKVGNPNFQAHVILTNTGGRSLRIRSISLEFARNGTHVFTLPAQTYLQDQTDKDAVLFTPFVLRAEEDWSHIVNFLNFFGREDEKRYRDIESALRQDIVDKKNRQPDMLVEADEKNVKPLKEFFEEKFSWHAGEYQLTVVVKGDKAESRQTYRFTVFESESDELRKHIDEYKYGARVYWEPSEGAMAGISVQVHGNHA